jgi:hypothetical protein
MASGDDARDLAALALAETADAVKVLSEGALASSVEPGILSARANLVSAKMLLQNAQHMERPAVDNMFQVAASRLRAARSDLADPATLPASYGN